MKVIGIAGKAQSGKGTCSKIIRARADALGLKTLEWAYAEPLKAMIYARLKGEESFETIWDIKPPHIRTLLQQVGTEQHRMVYGLEFWLHQAEAFYRLFERSGVDLVICPDVRFPNEVDFAMLNGKAPELYLKKCYEDARNHYAFDDTLEEYLLDTDIDTLYWTEMQVSGLQADLYTSQRLRGRCFRILTDRPSLDEESAKHISETALDTFPEELYSAVISNNLSTTLEELEAQLVPLVDAYLGENDE